MVDAISQHVASTTFVAGVPDVGSNDTSGVAAAAAAAAAADLVVLAIGSDLLLEREGHDRTVIEFSSGQLALIAAVAAAAKGPVVAVVFGGGATDITPLQIPGVEVIVWAGQPSVQVVGIPDVLFGKTLDGRAVAPAGRMTFVLTRTTPRPPAATATLTPNPTARPTTLNQQADDLPGRLREPSESL